MTDVGQELILGPVRRFRRFLGLTQLRLEPFAFGDILHDRDDIAGVPAASRWSEVVMWVQTGVPSLRMYRFSSE